LSALLTISNVPSVDSDQNFTVPIKGTGLSFVQPSTPQLDFGAEAFGETSPPQLLNFTNNGVTPVQILPQGICVNSSFNQFYMLPHPLQDPGSAVAGLQVASNLRQDTNNSTIDYSCDTDPNTLLPNFQISADSCSGVLLQPLASCGLEISFAPQSLATYFSALGYFLELNTVQCTDPVNDPPSPSNPCELDGGRFPVELTANITSPLRMSPAAGLNFGSVPVHTSSTAQTVTLLNDPSVTPPQTVTFVGKIVVTGNYLETDNCPYSLAPGSSCTLTVNFTPTSKKPSLGNLAINYTTNSNNSLQTQTVYLFGTGQ
jgi:Abnormal spindle-like microcephaly-assoc'd, ASPM-SPD-2-Hydin